MDSVLALHPEALGSILGIPEDFPVEIYFHVAEIINSTALLSIKRTV